MLCGISAHKVVRVSKDIISYRKPSDFVEARFSSDLRCRIDYHSYSFATDDAGADSTSRWIDCCAAEYVNDRDSDKFLTAMKVVTM